MALESRVVSVVELKRVYQEHKGEGWPFGLDSEGYWAQGYEPDRTDPGCLDLYFDEEDGLYHFAGDDDEEDGLDEEDSEAEDWE